jgi:hypothetical protein
MSDYLQNLAARSLGRAQAISPRLASAFEPVTYSAPAVEIEQSSEAQAWQDLAPGTEVAQELQPRSPAASSHVSRLQRASAIDATGMAAQSIGQVAETRPEPTAVPESNAPPESTTAPQQPIARRSENGPSIERPLSARAREAQLIPPQPASAGAQPQITPLEAKRAARALDSFESKTPIASPAQPVERRVGQRLAQPAANLRGEPQAAPPGIKITIGRVEVRALMPEPRPARRKPAPRSALSLDDYLKRR